MENDDLIPVLAFCASHEVDISFVVEWKEHELVELVNIEDNYFVSPEEIRRMERIKRLHDLGVNLEGIEVINELLDKLDRLKNEKQLLLNRLRIYEDEQY